MLVLGASNIRLIIENWMKYGLLIRVPHHSHIPVRDLGLFMLAWLSVPLSLLISLVVEYGMGKLAVAAKDAKPDFLKKLTILERVVAVTHVSHLVFLLTFPSYLAYTQIYHPLGKYLKGGAVKCLSYSPNFFVWQLAQVLLLFV